MRCCIINGWQAVPHLTPTDARQAHVPSSLLPPPCSAAARCSGPGDVQQLKLGTDAGSLKRLLSFLTMSFNGGTDVDAPLALSLDRVGREEWSLADILMVGVQIDGICAN